MERNPELWVDWCGRVRDEVLVHACLQLRGAALALSRVLRVGLTGSQGAAVEFLLRAVREDLLAVEREMRARGVECKSEDLVCR